MRCVAIMLLLCACGGGGGTDAPPDADRCAAAETCNGLDDDCDRLVDEGCPCEPFTVETPQPIRRAVSLGDGWAGLFGDQTLVHLTSAGVLDVQLRLFDAVRPAQLAWNGDELAYLATPATDTYLAFIRPDGTGWRAGPARGERADPVGSPAVGLIAGEYHVIYTQMRTPLPDVMYAVTDGVAGWHDELAANATNAAWPVGLTSRGDSPIALWQRHAGPSGEHTLIGPPWTFSEVGTISLATLTSYASDGENVLVTFSNLYRYDGTSVTEIFGSSTDLVAAVAWSGKSWWIVTNTAPGANLGELDTGFAQILNEPLGPPSMEVRGGGLAADAGRLLITFSGRDPNTTVWHYFATQRCL